MIRSDALTHLVNEFASFAAVTGQLTTDVPAGYGSSLDQALRQLGYVTADLATADVPDASIGDYLKLAEYFALTRFARSLALAVDVETDVATGKRSRSGLFEKVLKLQALAKTELEDAGYLAGGWQSGYLTLDYLEPSESAV